MNIENVTDFLEKKYDINLLNLLDEAENWWSQYVANYPDTVEESKLAEQKSCILIKQFDQVFKDLKDVMKEKNRIKKGDYVVVKYEGQMRTGIVISSWQDDNYEYALEFTSSIYGYVYWKQWADGGEVLEHIKAEDLN